MSADHFVHMQVMAQKNAIGSRMHIILVLSAIRHKPPVLWDGWGDLGL